MKFQVIKQEIYKYNFLYETSKNPSKIPKKVFILLHIPIPIVDVHAPITKQMNIFLTYFGTIAPFIFHISCIIRGHAETMTVNPFVKGINLFP